MRILLVGDYDDDPRLGSTKVLYKLREQFVALGHRCDLMLRPEIGGVAARHLRDVMSPIQAARKIAVTAKQNGGYDVVDIASAEMLWIAAQRRLFGRPRIALINRSNGLEDLNFRRMVDDARGGLTKKPWYRRIWYPTVRLPQVRMAARFADALIVLNEGDRQFALRNRWKSADDVHVVRHGISEYRIDEPVARDWKSLLFCGSWDIVKGVPYMVRAFEDVARSEPGVSLTILGGGSGEAEIRGAFAADVRGAVRVIPRQNEREVFKQYRAHGFLIFPSSYEGFGMVVPEALSQGMIVIATPVGCVPDLIEPEKNGYIVPLRDAEALARTIRRALNDERRDEISAAARKTRLATWTQCAQETLAVYDAALSKQH